MRSRGFVSIPFSGEEDYVRSQQRLLERELWKQAAHDSDALGDIFGARWALKVGQICCIEERELAGELECRHRVYCNEIMTLPGLMVITGLGWSSFTTAFLPGFSPSELGSRVRF